MADNEELREALRVLLDNIWNQTQSASVPHEVNRAKFERIPGVKAAEAALASRSPSQGVAVKALEWKEPSWRSNGCWTADSPFGTYSVVNEGGWHVSRDETPRDFYFEWAGQDMSRDTLDTAKAAAQSDYERRVRSALASTAPEGVRDALTRSEIEALKHELARRPSTRHFEILAEAMAEVKATSDGPSDQPIADIVAGCLTEIAALSPVPAEAPADAGWRDMSSAPKDGKHCILAVQYGAFVYSIQGAYRNGQWDVVDRDNVQPLAWMPNVLLPDHLRPWKRPLAALSDGERKA